MSDRDPALQAALDVLELERTGETSFVGHSLQRINDRVFGGQVLAQALLAAGRTLPAGPDVAPRLPHSVHGYFLRPGRVDVPIGFEVEKLRDGGSFSARRTHAIQEGKPILSMISSFQEEQRGVSHADDAPDVPGPEELTSGLDVLGAIDHPAAQFLVATEAFDIRHVDEQIYLPDANREPATHQRLWMRARGDVEGDQLFQRALLAYACDQVMLEPIMRRHGLAWLSPDLGMASLDHAMWWHRPVAVDEWLLYVQETPSAEGGRGLGLARVFDTHGHLVATIAQEGMVRVPQSPDSA